MTTQPTALRLADALKFVTVIGSLDAKRLEEAAAELRRLHAELAESEKWRDRDEVRAANAEKARDIAEAQRDALLATLKELTGHINERFSGGVWDRARAAIKQAEGENT